jgi:hypothetical protein
MKKTWAATGWFYGNERILDTEEEVICFERDCGPVVRQTTDSMNEGMNK